jgi:hypothetical protein
MTKYRIYASLHEESNEGWIWLPEGIDRIQPRDFIIIKRKGYKSAIRCQARTIDERFSNFYKKRLKEYKEKNNEAKRDYVDLLDQIKSMESLPIVMNDYYRKILHIKPRDEYDDLEIFKADHFYQKLLAFIHHPNDVVKIATYLALISIITSVTFGILSIIPDFSISIIVFFYFLIVIAILLIVFVILRLFIQSR